MKNRRQTAEDKNDHGNTSDLPPMISANDNRTKLPIENVSGIQTTNRIIREMNNIVDTLENRFQYANLTTVNSVIVLRIKLPDRSMDVSSGQDVPSASGWF